MSIFVFYGNSMYALPEFCKESFLHEQTETPDKLVELRPKLKVPIRSLKLSDMDPAEMHTKKL